MVPLYELSFELLHRNFADLLFEENGSKARVESTKTFLPRNLTKPTQQPSCEGRLVASNGQSAISAKNSARADEARYTAVRLFEAVS